MTSPTSEARSSNALSRFQLFPFAALSASYFAHIGFFNPYLPLWLKDLGFSITIIGLLTAVQAATRVLAPYGWGWLSDHTGERVKLLRFCAGAALICSAGLLVEGSLVWIAVVLLLMFIHTSAMMPMSEAALAHLVSTDQGFDSRRYGRVRLWGSLGFLVTVFVAGAWFEVQGMQSFPAWSVGSLVLLNLSVWWLPNRKEAVHHDEVRPSVMPVLRQRQVQWFFATVFFHVLSHIGIYVFFSLYLDELGYSKTMIGVLWAVSVAAEIVWFFTQSRWLPKFSLSMWMLICAAAMVLRMGLTTWAAEWLLALLCVASMWQFNRVDELDIWAIYFFAAYGLGVLAAWAKRSTFEAKVFWVTALLAAGALWFEYRTRLSLALLTAVWLVIKPKGMVHWTPMKRVVHRLSNSAYVLFLTHFGIIVLFSDMWNKSHFYDPSMAFALTGFAWLCCVGMGLFLHEKAEVPIHHWVAQTTKPLFSGLAR